MKLKRIKFVRRDLKLHWGDADEYPLVMDKTCCGKKELEIYVHEAFHYMFPQMGEPEIVKKSILLTNTLWHEGFRKVDNRNKIRLQDGTK